MTVRIMPSAQLHFLVLPPEAQLVAVRRLALTGMSDHDIAAATGWPLDNVRRVVAEERPPALHTVFKPSVRQHQASAADYAQSLMPAAGRARNHLVPERFQFIGLLSE